MKKLSPNQQKPMALVGSTTNIEQWKVFLTITGLTLHSWRVSVIPILTPLKEWLVGQAKKWKDATYPMYMAIYLDILSPIRRISVAMQSDFHDPVKVVKRIKEFWWTMVKLVLVLDEALDKEGSVLTHFTKLMKEIKVKENGKHEYQGDQLKYYNHSFQSVKDHYLITVSNICECVEQRFESLFDSSIFESIKSVLDTFTWPIDGDYGQFGNKEID